MVLVSSISKFLLIKVLWQVNVLTFQKREKCISSLIIVKDTQVKQEVWLLGKKRSHFADSCRGSWNAELFYDHFGSNHNWHPTTSHHIFHIFTSFLIFFKSVIIEDTCLSINKRILCRALKIYRSNQNVIDKNQENYTLKICKYMNTYFDWTKMHPQNF